MSLEDAFAQERQTGRKLRDALAQLEADNTRLRSERDEAAATACKWATENKGLREELSTARLMEDSQCRRADDLLAKLTAAREEIADMRSACSEPIADDPRMSYVEVQIGREDWERLFRPAPADGAAGANILCSECGRLVDVMALSAGATCSHKVGSEASIKYSPPPTAPEKPCGECQHWTPKHSGTCTKYMISVFRGEVYPCDFRKTAPGLTF